MLYMHIPLTFVLPHIFLEILQIFFPEIFFPENFWNFSVYIYRKFKIEYF